MVQCVYSFITNKELSQVDGLSTVYSQWHWRSQPPSINALESVPNYTAL